MNEAKRRLSLRNVLLVAVLVSALAWVISGLMTSMAMVSETSLKSQLWEIGKAAAIYQEEHGAFRSSTQPLVEVKLIDPAILSSPGDLATEGLANRIRAQWGKPPAPYRDSFPALGDFPPMPRIAGLGAPKGWLIAYDRHQAHWLDRGGSPLHRRGTMLRLQFDGSVVSRPIPSTSSVSFFAPRRVHIRFQEFFADPAY